MDPPSHKSTRLQSHSSVDFSSTSALDIGTSSSGPSSPVLGNLTSREGSTSRRRLSWGRLERQRVDGSGDPLRINTSMSDANTRRGEGGSDDPFAPEPESETPKEDDALAPGRTLPSSYYPARHEEAGTSQQSLVGSFYGKLTSDYDVDLDDDEMGLTAYTSRGLALSDSLRPDQASMDHDVERTPDRTSKRRYSLTPSPGSKLRSVKKTLRRASMRVVNLAGVNLEDRAQAVRLPDDKSKGKAVIREEEEELPDLAKRLPIRGRTVGLFGPTSRIRLAMFRFLTHPYVYYNYLFVRS